jgi:hypothetical protein
MLREHLSEVDNDATALCLYPVWREVWRKALLGALRHRQTAVEECLLVLVLQVRDKLLHCTLKGLGHQMKAFTFKAVLSVHAQMVF